MVAHRVRNRIYNGIPYNDILYIHMHILEIYWDIMRYTLYKGMTGGLTTDDCESLGKGCMATDWYP